MIRVSYNPWRCPERPAAFFIKATGEDFAVADLVVFLSDGTVWAKNPR
jgi:hypothetical protein